MNMNMANTDMGADLPLSLQLVAQAPTALPQKIKTTSEGAIVTAPINNPIGNVVPSVVQGGVLVAIFVTVVPKIVMAATERMLRQVEQNTVRNDATHSAVLASMNKGQDVLASNQTLLINTMLDHLKVESRSMFDILEKLVEKVSDLTESYERLTYKLDVLLQDRRSVRSQDTRRDRNQNSN